MICAGFLAGAHLESSNEDALCHGVCGLPQRLRGAGIGTIIAFELVGRFSDARQAVATHPFDPIMIAAGLLPFAGMILVLLLVRNTRPRHRPGPPHLPPDLIKFY
jgi:hypothetical protein